MRRILSILLTFALLLGMQPSAHAKGKPRAKEGDYNITVAGFVTGTGVAVVSSGRVKLQANVTDGATGAGGELNAANLAISGAHFSGTGNILGQQFKFRGRLDYPDPDEERAIKGVRLVCTFHTEDGKKYGRIVGFIPALAAAPDPDRNKQPANAASKEDKDNQEDGKSKADDDKGKNKGR